MKNPFAPIEDVLAALSRGQMVILVDDEKRENEGDLVMAAAHVTPEAINFMSKEGRGLICLSMTGKDLDRLDIPMMPTKNINKLGTAFTISIEANEGVSTGISASDRAHTIKVAIDPTSQSKDIVSPGHVFPLRAREGGVLVREGQTEGSVDLCRLANLPPQAVICEIMNDDGTMARLPDLEKYAEKHNLFICSIADLIAYRLKNETVVTELASAKMPIEPFGQFTIKVFSSIWDNVEHVALIKTPIDMSKPVLVRIHSECLTGDVFGSDRCDCGEQRTRALEKIAHEGGVLLYMRQEGRGIGLANKIKAYALQETGMDTVEANESLGFLADQRHYGISAQILKILGLSSVRLMTNNPDKINSLERYGIEVARRVALTCEANKHNKRYLQTKSEKLGHLLKESLTG